MGLSPLWVQVFCIYLRFGLPCNNIYAIEHFVTGEFCFSIGVWGYRDEYSSISRVCATPQSVIYCVRGWYMCRGVELYSSWLRWDFLCMIIAVNIYYCEDFKLLVNSSIKIDKVTY